MRALQYEVVAIDWKMSEFAAVTKSCLNPAHAIFSHMQIVCVCQHEINAGTLDFRFFQTLTAKGLIKFLIAHVVILSRENDHVACAAYNFTWLLEF